MKKPASKYVIIVSIVSAVAAVVAAVTALLVYFDKKKDEAELERYLDESIQ